MLLCESIVCYFICCVVYPVDIPQFICLLAEGHVCLQFLILKKAAIKISSIDFCVTINFHFLGENLGIKLLLHMVDFNLYKKLPNCFPKQPYNFGFLPSAFLVVLPSCQHFTWYCQYTYVCVYMCDCVCVCLYSHCNGSVMLAFYLVLKLFVYYRVLRVLYLLGYMFFEKNVIFKYFLPVCGQPFLIFLT